MKHQGTLDISRPSNSEDRNFFRISLRDKTSPRYLVEIEIGAEDLAMALSGRARLPVVYEMKEWK